MSCATGEVSGQSAQLHILIKHSMIVFTFDSQAVQGGTKSATAMAHSDQTSSWLDCMQLLWTPGYPRSLLYTQYGSGSFCGPILQSAIFRRVVWSKPLRVKKFYSKLCARYSEDIQRTSVYPWYSECLQVFASGDRLFCTGKFDHSDHSLTRL